MTTLTEAQFREALAEVLYETECDPPVYGLTRDQAAKLADALIASGLVQPREVE